MTTTILRPAEDILYSVFKWAREQSYTVGATTGPLTTHHTGLVIRPGFPDDLVTLAAPTLALTGPTAIQPGDDFFGGSVAEDIYTLSWFGFIVGQGSDVSHRAYRDRLMNDVVQLLRRAASEEGVDLYSAADGTRVTDAVEGDATIEVTRVDARLVPVNAPELDVERYKFVCDCDVAIMVTV